MVYVRLPLFTPFPFPAMIKSSSSSAAAMTDASTKSSAKKLSPDQQAKAAAIKAALDQIKKQYGDGAIMEMNETSAAAIPRFPSGSLSLDLALGGGMPTGRIVEIFGPESSGKTTIALHAIAEAQRAGGRAAFIDAEHALDLSYAKKIGVDVDTLLVSQPDDGEQALAIVETLVRSGAVDIIVVDSVAALTPKAEIDGTMGDTHVGLQARLMSQALRKLTGIVSKTRCSVVFINQIRMKIGVMFGNPETTTGGNALKFYASIRMDVRRIDKILEKSSDDGQEVVGNRTRVKVVKNKTAPPFRQAEFDILYAKGISREGDLIDLGLRFDILEKSGAYIRYGEQTIGQGREAAKAFLASNASLTSELEDLIRQRAAAQETL